jgi:hypothetical protein
MCFESRLAEGGQESFSVERADPVVGDDDAAAWFDDLGGKLPDLPEQSLTGQDLIR